MLSKQLNRWEPVVVDVESYRARRRSSLRRLALRMAERVASGRRRVVLEAMPAYERRIVHLALHDHPNVTTKSVGEGSHRKVTIIPK
jgi:spoIIIJ-associated protein